MTRTDRTASEPDAAQVLRSIGEAAYEWHLDSDALIWSANAGHVLGIADAGLIDTGSGWAQRVDVEPGHSRFDAVTRSNQRDDGNGVFYQVQYAFRPSVDDERIWLEDTGRWFGGADGLPRRAHGVVRVITERHAREENLTHLARFDALTGEMNRVAMVETLQATLDEAVRFRAACGFLLVAIDALERINESYGFEVADELIAQVSRRLRQRMRGCDHIGRFSGNKFGIILKNCTPDEMTIAAERFLTSMREDTLLTSAGAVSITVSIGGVTAPRHARNVPEILSRAQDALSEARARRRGSFVAYRPSAERDAMRRDSVRATDEIIAALNERRIALAFEPVVGAVSRRIGFYECLMRVVRADGSVINANNIIPIAERIGLVRMLDHRVMELVIRELAEAPGLRVSVNVSASSAMDTGWWTSLASQLRANAGIAERLTIEITETAAIQDVDDTRGFVSRVKDLGCRIAIDDFGAGYTSFRNLRKLGVDIVKIDGAFVRDMATSADDHAFVQTLLELARRLGIKSVAEWVQDERTARMLTELGCDYLQGELVGLASSYRPWRPNEAGRAIASA